MESKELDDVLLRVLLRRRLLEWFEKKTRERAFIDVHFTPDFSGGATITLYDMFTPRRYITSVISPTLYIRGNMEELVDQFISFLISRFGDGETLSPQPVLGDLTNVAILRPPSDD